MQCRKERTHAIKREILHLSGRARRTREHELSDWYATRIESRNERRNSARRHERARTVYIRNDFRHRLIHIRVLMKHELHQGDALDVLRFNVFDASDVEEVILVVIREEAFHLRGIHAAIRLRHINSRITELWKNICRHAANRQSGCEHDREHSDRYAYRSAHGSNYEPHYFCTSLRNGCRSPCAAATASRARQIFRRASASSISAFVSRRCASANSVKFARPDSYRARA